VTGSIEPFFGSEHLFTLRVLVSTKFLVSNHDRATILRLERAKKDYIYIRADIFPTLMPTLERSAEVAASPETVWGILVDPTYIPKLYPDILTAVPNEPGLAKVGTTVAMVGKIAGRKINVDTEVTEMETNSKLVVRTLPGGIMKKYLSTTSLEPTKRGSKVTVKVEYEAAAGYLGKALSVLVVNRTIRNNILKSLQNLKEISQLKSLPGSSTS
jgi:carbon monoxide dehydrogenase subunit G